MRIHIDGIVQGVGFRPFVYGLATRLGLNGWVRNTSAGVDIAVDGPQQILETFARLLQEEAPPLARIDALQVTWQPPDGFAGFEIVHSQVVEAAFQPVSPDVSICADCLHELFDPADRRYRYPFINCTNCGPRFTIIRDLPYDRPLTTMAGFPLCPDCTAEYQDPLNRRFHAQPVACEVCGPQVWLEARGCAEPLSQREDAIHQARELLRDGKILAVKGLGGFHLACDATNAEAVIELRRRKLRVDKPFALMVPDLQTAAAHCLLSSMEKELLLAHTRPIVIVRRRPNSPIAAQVAPGQATIGIMLPYTPLHYLLFAAPGSSPVVFDLPPLVMTSGNLSEEPICTDNEEARQRLDSLADVFLLHNRDIHVRCDDSVVRMFPALPPTADAPSPLKGPAAVIYPLRRSRGYAPDPLRLPVESPPLLATGAELKNTYALARQRYAFLSHHIGDLENYETLQAFETGIAHYERLFRIQPQAIAYDLHPNYLATRAALDRAQRENLPSIGVQHHHAHIAACMAEHGLIGDHPVIGVAFDGTGYGEDGAIWGGEFLVADYRSYQRAAHLAYVPLPGGDAAARQPWRMALAWLHAAGIQWEDDLPPVAHAVSMPFSGDLPTQPLPGGRAGWALDALHSQLRSGLNAPLTSSMGRLFDAAAALVGVRAVVNYEAQAAIEFEALADGRETVYYPLEFPIEFGARPGIVDPTPLLHAIVADLRAGLGVPQISARFHGGIAHMIVSVCLQLRDQFDIHEVALSGGVWQNMFLLALTIGFLRENGFTVYIHRQVPANDGGLALGQLMVAIARLKG
jgi:hydrogenase maturation protein HypF